MTKEEKQLSLQDLCARLPYGVKATTTANGWRDVYVVSGYNDDRIYLDCPVYDEGDDEWLVESVRPYLRPMSSMTEEEKKTYEMFFNEDGLLNTSIDTYLDWLLENHFDYRGLIPKGLAIEATEDMYDIK